MCLALGRQPILCRPRPGDAGPMAIPGAPTTVDLCPFRALVRAPILPLLDRLPSHGRCVHEQPQHHLFRKFAPRYFGAAGLLHRQSLQPGRLRQQRLGIDGLRRPERLRRARRAAGRRMTMERSPRRRPGAPSRSHRNFPFPPCAPSTIVSAGTSGPPTASATHLTMARNGRLRRTGHRPGPDRPHDRELPHPARLARVMRNAECSAGFSGRGSFRCRFVPPTLRPEPGESTFILAWRFSAARTRSNTHRTWRTGTDHPPGSYWRPGLQPVGPTMVPRARLPCLSTKA